MKVVSLGIALAIIAILSLLAPVSPVSADKGPRTYQFLVGSGLLCDLDPSGCPDISMADNGDTIAVAGSGTFSLQPFTATGSGTFLHKSPTGEIKGNGTWVVLRLVAFHSFGDATPQGLPSNLEGGQLLLLVQLQVGGTPVFNAILNVDCALGRPPPGQSEGITLAVQNVINFNKKVSGFTVFIRT